MALLADMVARGWHNFLARPTGSLNLRFIFQPAVASAVALRAGIKDPKQGHPAYLWAALTDAEHRRWHLLYGGAKEIRTPFVVAAILDAVYQMIEHEFIYPLELLFTATLLAVVPYVILRGPVNRVARRFIGGDQRYQAADPDADRQDPRNL